MSVVYKRSPLAVFLEELPSLLLKREAAKADREYGTQLYLLKHEIENQRMLDRDLRNLQQTSSELGITQTDVEKVGDLDATPDIDKIIGATGDKIVNIRSDLVKRNKESEDKIDALQENITYFNIGRSLGRLYGDRDPKTFSEEELEGIKSSERFFKSTEAQQGYIIQGASQYDPDFYEIYAKKASTPGTDEYQEVKSAARQEEVSDIIAKAQITGELESTKTLKGLEETYTGFNTLGEPVPDEETGIESSQGALNRWHESINESEEFKFLDTDQLLEIVNMGVEGGHIYEDAVVGVLEPSDRDALDAGLVEKSAEWLDTQDLWGIKGYPSDRDREENSVRWVEFANNYKAWAMKGLQENEDYRKYSTDYEASLARVQIDKAMEADVANYIKEQELYPQKLKDYIFEKTDKDVLEPRKKWKKESGVSEEEFNSVINQLSRITDHNYLDILMRAKPSFGKVIKYIGGDEASTYVRYVNVITGMIESGKVKTDVIKEPEAREQKLEELLDKILE